MFAKDKGSDKGPAQQPMPAEPSRSTPTLGTTAKAKPGMPSIISSDLKVIGNLESAGDIQVDGTVEGNINSRTVTISEGAHIEGSIFADTAHLSGSIKGQVKAPTVNIAKSAKVVGDIIHESLSIEAGAYLEGNYRRIESDSKPKSVDVKSEAAKPTQPAQPAQPAVATASVGKPVVR